MSEQRVMQQIGPYRLEEEIGRGGMATVYRVTDPHGKIYALKLLHPGPRQDKRWGTRFQREFRLLSRLRHTHLIEVHDYGEDKDHAYYVMDYIDGKNLWSFYREDLRSKPTTERLIWLIPLVSQLVSALDYIHHHRVIHKDLKPANILLEHNGENAYLVDFGLARDLKDNALYTHPGFIGTLGYSPPEIIDRRRLDGRADIYSLGVILYTLLADRRPIQVEGRAFPELLQAIREEEPTPIQHLVKDIPPAVASLIHRCIEKDPANRYRDTRELWRDLLPVLAHFQTLRNQNTASSAPEDLHTRHKPHTPESLHSSPLSHSGMLMESELLGRTKELTLCHNKYNQLFSQQAEQQSQVLFFYGLPGVGKSFLLEEVTRDCQRQDLQIHTIRLRPQTDPFVSIAEILRPLIKELPLAARESQSARFLAQYIPMLQDVLPHSTISAGTLTQPVAQMVQILLPMFLQFPSHVPLVWIVDDFEHADPTSQAIVARLVYALLTQSTLRFLFIGASGYQPGNADHFVKIPQHSNIEHHHIQPLTEEEEAQFVAKLLGRRPDQEELSQLRNLTRGLPRRTLELVHQGSILAQSPSIPATEDAMSSVSTALHDLSAIRSELGLTAQGAVDEEPPDSTMMPSKMPRSPATKTQNSSAFSTFTQTEVLTETLEKDSFLHPSSKQPTVPNLPSLEALNRSIESESTVPRNLRNLEALRDAWYAQEDEASFSEELILPSEEEDETTSGSIFDPNKTHTKSSTQILNQEDLVSFTEVESSASEFTWVEEKPGLQELIKKVAAKEASASLAEEQADEEMGERTFSQPNVKILGPPPAITGPFQPKTHLLEEEDDDPEEGATLAPSESQIELQRFAESSEELLLIPLLHRRLSLLSTEDRLHFAATTFLSEEFTCAELQGTLQSTSEEALDLLNELLTLRLLKAELQQDEEYYGYLHPVMNQILLAGVPSEQLAEFRLRAAHAMAHNREKYHRKHNATLLAMRFAEGGEVGEAFRWQIFATQQAFQAQIDTQLKENLKRLQNLQLFWLKQGAEEELRGVLPGSFCENQPIPPLHQVGASLLKIGVLLQFGNKDEASAESKKVREHLRILLKPKQRQFQNTMAHLQPLLNFARLRVRKKK